MAAQNSSASLALASPRSHASHHRSDKPKRARTKHACDECRRSQKRCDGQKPCARCKANGTACQYTPHKARNQCICTGADGKDGQHELVPEVVIFNHDPLGSATFHTGTFSTLNCSPEQLPAQAGMLTPSPTFASHDEMLVQDPSTYYTTSASAGQQTNGYSMPAAPHYVPAPHQQQQFHNHHNNMAHMQVHVQRTQLYSHRSHSVPNVSTTLTPVAHAPFISPPVVSTALPYYTSSSSSFDQQQQQSPTSEASSFSSPYAAHFAQQQQQLADSPTSLYDSLQLPSSLAATEAGTASTGMHDFVHTPPPSSEISVNHSSTYSFYPGDDRPGVPLPTNPYEDAANLATGQEQQQQFTPLDAHGRPLLHSHLYGAGSVSTNTPTTPSNSSSVTQQQQDIFGSLLFHDDGHATQVQHPTPSYYNQEIVASQYELGMQQQQQLHSPLGGGAHAGYQGSSSPLLSSQHENFVNSHTPSPNPPATPTDAMLPPHVHHQLHHPHNQYGYAGANEQGGLGLVGQTSLSLPPPPTSHLLRWPSRSSPLTVHTGTPLLDAHNITTDGGSGSAGPSPTSFGAFDYPAGGLHGQWTQ